jgi:hypothetical protein
MRDEKQGGDGFYTIWECLAKMLHMLHMLHMQGESQLWSHPWSGRAVESHYRVLDTLSLYRHIQLPNVSMVLQGVIPSRATLPICGELSSNDFSTITCGPLSSSNHYPFDYSDIRNDVNPHPQPPSLISSQDSFGNAPSTSYYWSHTTSRNGHSTSDKDYTSVHLRSSSHACSYRPVCWVRSRTRIS